ncbi:AP-3 complex subunit mu-2 [Dinochytrium kinnereticum]|nr:AP-3 complex subunit mu-2 [Dinochytrium kinnereticum]
MIDSLLIVDAGSFCNGGTPGKAIIEKHYRSAAAGSQATALILDEFWTHVGKNMEADGSTNPSPHVIPLHSTSEYYLIHIMRGNIFFVAVFGSETDPMNVATFLHQMVNLFLDYFGEITEVSIKDNFSAIYELLEEMLDHGKPYITEPNILKELIPPPSLLSTVINAVSIGTNFGVRTPTGALSHIPWRTTGLKYTNNEIFFDVGEDIDVIIDRYGNIVNGNIQGEISCVSRLSGMPDLTLMFGNSRIFDEQLTSFHPCVRFPRFQRDRVLSFIPPDGEFKLMSYTLPLTSVQSLPMSVKPTLQLTKSGGKLNITLTPRNTSGKPLELLTLTVPLPPYISSINLNATHGTVSFDQSTKVVRWVIPKLGTENNVNVTASLTGVVYLEADHPVGSGPPPVINVGVTGRVTMFAASGVRIDTLQVLNEAYKPFKGVKLFTRAREFYVRS